MAKIEFGVNGWGKEGQMLVACGDDLCFKDVPQPVARVSSGLPPIPKLVKDQRAVLVVEAGKQPSWKVRTTGVSRGEAAGTSLGMILGALVAYHFFRDWWDSKE